MNKIGLLSLAYRRFEANLVFLHKLIDERVNAPSILSLIGKILLTSTESVGRGTVYFVSFHAVNQQIITNILIGF